MTLGERLGLSWGGHPSPEALWPASRKARFLSAIRFSQAAICRSRSSSLKRFGLGCVIGVVTHSTTTSDGIATPTDEAYEFRRKVGVGVIVEW